MAYILHSHLFLDAVTGTAGGPRWSTPYPADWHFNDQQNRTFFITQNQADTVTIQVTNNFEVTANTVWFTTTAATGAAASTVNLEGPYACIRVGITGANGAATVKGLV